MTRAPIPETERRIPLASAPNMRELGGIPVAGGMIRRGQLFRSASLAKLDPVDQATFAELGITTVFDLRTAAERDGAEDQLPPGTRTVWLDVVADAPDNVAAQIPELIAHPDRLQDVLGGGAAERYLEDANRAFVSSSSALAAYRALFLELLDPARTGAALFHCTTGKDRTGWAATAFLLLCGADEATVRADYLQTNVELAPVLAPMIAALEAQGVEASLLRPILEVRDSYFDAGLAEMRARYGTIEDYARDGLGLSGHQLTALRERFVVAA
ncbi:possible protein-tyrosine phosphatase [Leucobacter sp. 7(1)]|uniref:tyrosine-protein phosphatase n=1 Tax=Leucobacter sp. 7(1) TaxID=1255613 RepID=UPI00097F670A|nr:tyrosine-protein phosphatase [Leucobacter sp. 7(1)]SJN12906.1 possible protein-tyrosine phosphatase [Leucobacter sp. 7(1)]